MTVTFATVTPARFDHERLKYAGAVYDDGKLVAQSIRPPLAWKFAEFDGPKVEGTETDEPLRLASAIYLGRFFFHFGHFLVETLPNFAYADAASPLIVHPWPDTFSRSLLNISYLKLSLEALGVEQERLVFANKLIHVDRLVVAPRNEVMANRPSPHTIPIFRRIAEHVRRDPNIESPERIYFSRKRFGGKRKTDEEEWVEDIFRGLDFAIVYPEALPFAEQVALAAGARIVAGIDGSALHLCGFMKAAGRCLVISTRARHTMIETINSMAGVDTDWIDNAGVFDEKRQVLRLNRDIVEDGLRKWGEDLSSGRWSSGP